MSDADGAARTASKLPTNGGEERSAVGDRRALGGSVALASVLGSLYLIAGRMGPDLAAQIAHADFAAAHPLAVVDFRWFGGTLPFGYSLWTPLVMAVLGVRVTGLFATVAAVALFAELLRRVDAPRQRLASVAAAVTFTASLAEGRVTFVCGLVAGLAAMVVLAGPPGLAGPVVLAGPPGLPRPSGLPGLAGPSTSSSGRRRHRRLAVAAVLSVVAGAASPVVALYLLLAAVAALVQHRRDIACALGAAVGPLVVTSVIFGDAGRQVFSANDAIRALLATALVLALTPRRHRVLHTGIALALAMVLLAWLLPTPVGSNSARLSLLFAVPVTAAYARLPRPLAGLCVVLVALIQPPVVFGTLSGAGRPVTRAAYFAPLAAELDRRGPLTGRVEVPELTGHWDAAYLARSVPLSRGWLRQLDTRLNDDVFYRHLPTAQTYRAFLDRTATQYVAVADARATFYGRRERTLIDAGLPYLRTVWRNEHWTLYAVNRPVPIVATPGALVAYRADRIEVRAPGGDDISVHIRWLRWLSVVGPPGACLRRDGAAVVLHAPQAGTYTITSMGFGARHLC